MLKIDHRKKFNLLVALGATSLVFVLKIVLFSYIETSGIWESLIFSIVAFLIFPFFLIKFVFGERASDYNFKFQIIGKNAIWTILTIAMLASVVIFCVVKFDWDRFLIVSNWIVGGRGIMLFVDIVLLPVIIFSQDFFFRGFLLESLGGYWNKIVSILAVSFLYTAFFYFGDKDLIGLRFAFLFSINIFLTIITKLNKSIFPSALLMWAYLLSIDLLILQRILEVSQ